MTAQREPSPSRSSRLWPLKVAGLWLAAPFVVVGVVAQAVVEGIRDIYGRNR